jgi:hypothetical protein
MPRSVKAGAVRKLPREKKLWVDEKASNELLIKFFREHSSTINQFGKTVNQAFEAFVFSSAIRWYQRHGWTVEIVNPDKASGLVQLKYSTRGRPSKYTFARASKDGVAIQIRHQLRVATRYHHAILFEDVAANICADVAIIKDMDLSNMKTDEFIPNEALIAFGEAKHMPAFAELVASFIGLVHELKPESLALGQRPYIGPSGKPYHLSPFLYVSGHIQRTAQGVIQTIRLRGFDVDIFDYRSEFLFGEAVPTKLPEKGEKGESQ